MSLFVSMTVFGKSGHSKPRVVSTDFLSEYGPIIHTFSQGEGRTSAKLTNDLPEAWNCRVSSSETLECGGSQPA